MSTATAKVSVFLQMKTKVPEEMVQFYLIFCNIPVRLCKTQNHYEFYIPQTPTISLPLLTRNARFAAVALENSRCTMMRLCKARRGVKHRDPAESPGMLDTRVLSFSGADSLLPPCQDTPDEVKGLF